MSYSFSVQAATKAEAKEKIAKEWSNIVGQQSIHAADQKSAQAAAEAFVDALSEPDDTQQISVSASGSVSWYPGVASQRITAVSGTVNASLATKA